MYGAYRWIMKNHIARDMGHEMGTALICGVDKDL